MFLKIMMCYNIALFLLMDFLLDQSLEDLKAFLSSTLPNLFLVFVMDFLFQPIVTPVLDPLLSSALQQAFVGEVTATYMKSASQEV